MRVFVSSKFENQTEARRMMQMLRDAGHEITHDWTTESAEGLARDEYAIAMRGFADADYEGVRKADVLVIVNHFACRGAYVEEGVAMTLGKPIIVVYRERGEHVFFYRQGHHFARTMDDVVNLIDNLKWLQAQDKPSILNMPDPKPAELYVPAAETNYTKGRGGTVIDLIVMHTMQGTLNGTKAWFADPRAKSSAHYSIGFDGTLIRHVKDEDTAWHAGNAKYNRRSLGIELEGFMERGFYPEQMLKALTDLIAYLARTYKIPITRNNIIGHNEVPSPDGNGYGGAGHHMDPGEKFPWDEVMRRLNSLGVA